jgi:hypothetical protein
MPKEFSVAAFNADGVLGVMGLATTREAAEAMVREVETVSGEWRRPVVVESPEELYALFKASQADGRTRKKPGP